MSLLDVLRHDPRSPLVFTSGTFFLFFTAFVAVLVLLRGQRARFWAVLGFSLFYYYKCNGLFVMALFAVAVGDYWAARLIARSRTAAARKALLGASIALSLSLLLYFKYANFILANAAWLSGGPRHVLDVFLPVGISFYTFESISYVVDVYRGDCDPAETFVEYAFFLVYFPHSVAGPIVRARDLLPQIRRMPKATPEAISEGLGRIVMGLVKKALIADYVGLYSDLVFDHPKTYTGPEVLLGVYAYALQIFFDFSGYTDIALGISRLVGIELCENFDQPYRATSITDYWRRWHMSLSTWLRDYVYIPLGGNRRGKARQYANLFVTMLVGGLWHGASWTFVIWGGLHGAALAVHKAIGRPAGDGARASSARVRLRAAAGWLFTIHLVVFLWVFFRAGSLSTAAAIVRRVGGGWTNEGMLALASGRRGLFVAMVVGALWSLAPARLGASFIERFARAPALARAVAFVVVAQCIVQVRGTEITPFLYFQF